uniref:Uncharacterized protein n=1 Tax=Amphimedon queenslandica TaxID=400682 RepID=A0A1X7UWK5_AMPQE
LTCSLSFKSHYKQVQFIFLLPGNVTYLVCCEAIPQKDNFLIDKSFNTGKGANPVISMVHFCLRNHGLNSVNIHFNADNCTGQNKNNTVILYLVWRVMTGLIRPFQYPFCKLDTKFSQD